MILGPHGKPGLLSSRQEAWFGTVIIKVLLTGRLQSLIVQGCKWARDGREVTKESFSPSVSCRSEPRTLG